MSTDRWIGKIKDSAAPKIWELPTALARIFHRLHIVIADDEATARELFLAYYWDRFGLLLEREDYIIEPEITHGHD